MYDKFVAAHCLPSMLNLRRIGALIQIKAGRIIRTRFPAK
jgi:hypothetical protein